MALMRWNPTNDLASLHSAMDRLFSDTFGDAFSSPVEQRGGAVGGPGEFPTYHLPVDVTETENGYRIDAPVPGFRPQDVEVTFSDGVLTINARRAEEHKRENGHAVRRETAFGHYRRQVALPGDVRTDDIRATFDNGMLTIDVPRAPRPQPKKIQVTAGERQPVGAGSGRR